MFVHTITNTIHEVMNLRGTLDKTQSHHTCISYTTTFAKISYTTCITNTHVYLHKKQFCAKEHNTRSMRVCTQAQRESYMGTKMATSKSINLLWIQNPLGSQFMIILNFNPRILDFKPYIMSTKKWWPTYYICLLLMDPSLFGIPL